MNRYLLFVFLAASLAACSNDAPSGSGRVASAATQLSACDLLTKDQVEAASGLAINNVAARDHDVFSTCSFETDDWTKTIGLIYFPGLGSPASAEALAAQIEADLKRDEVDYAGLEPDTSIGDAAVHYQIDDGAMHIIVAHRGGHRVIINASTSEAAATLARQALAALGPG